jgi:hypothetical protein
MVEYTYKLDLDEPVEMGTRFKQEPRKGIGVQPKKEEPEADGWADMFYGLLQGYFGDEDEGKKALTKAPEQPSYDMDDALQTLKSVNLPSRISEPVIEGAPEKPEMGSREPFELEVDTIGNEALDRSGMRLVDVTDTEEGKLSNEEPLYKMAEEIDPGTIETKGLMSKPDDDSADGVQPTDGKELLDFIASGEGGYDSANRGTIKEGTTDKIVGSQMVASRGGKKISELTVDEILKYQAITDPNNKDRLFAVGKYQTDNRTFPMAVEALGLSGDTVFSPEVQERVGLYLVSEKPGRKRLSNYLKNIGDVSTNRAMLDLAMEFASIPVPYAIKKGTYADGKWPKVDLKAGDSFYASGGKGGNKAQHTVAETIKVLENAKGSVPSGNTRGTSPRPMLRPDEEDS